MVAAISSTEAVARAQTGDVWLFRGRSGADRAIRVFTNSPVNHVAMVVALDDLPPLLWHTELGQSIDSVWSGDRHRGAQLNRLDDALEVWTGKYRQLAFVRHFDGEITRDDGGRGAPGRRRVRGPTVPPHAAASSGSGCRGDCATRRRSKPSTAPSSSRSPTPGWDCSTPRTPANWFDPGRFWSGDRLELLGGAALGAEIAVTG